MAIFAAKTRYNFRGGCELFIKDAKDCLYGQEKENLVLSCWEELIPEWQFVPFIHSSVSTEPSQSQRRIIPRTHKLCCQNNISMSHHTPW